MFAPVNYVLLWIFPILQYSGLCVGEIQLPYLMLYSPGDPEYTDVVVRRVGENLTLVCELKGDALPQLYFWNYMPSDNFTVGENPYKIEPRAPALASRLTKTGLSVVDSGHYMCSAPPYSSSKFILVQNKSGECARGALWCSAGAGDAHGRCVLAPYVCDGYRDCPRWRLLSHGGECARGALWCSAGAGDAHGRCVLAPYVCDGYRDCPRGDDEAPGICLPRVCERPDKLNCTTGRCISEAACCRPGTSPANCRQPACCLEHPRYARLEGWGEPDYPALFEDRHAPDEYGFIQSTIYTVTACALIFMIAVVLLVSAICKMHMKRAALRSYTSRPPPHAQMARFPPCYEASRLLEERCLPAAHSPLASPQRLPPQYREEVGVSEACDSPAVGDERGFGLARLSALFASRYRQVSTENPDVELLTVSGHRGPPLAPYRSPAGDEGSLLRPELAHCARDLNYMQPRPLTLQLGRFQLSIPRLSRRRSVDRRPDTPNIAELNLDDVNFVRLNSNDTYTLNGRTIRLLGADFENYPTLNDTQNLTRPPPYTEAMRYKLFGPPPEYLSRDALNTTDNTPREEQARQNIEMPPCYDELSVNNAASPNGNVSNAVFVINNVNGNPSNDNTPVSSHSTVTVSNNASAVITVIAITENQNQNIGDVENNGNATFNDVINDLPPIDGDVNANGTERCVNETVVNEGHVNVNENAVNNNDC